ncbi:MAG: YhgE/Pip family protein [Christensenellales bacterium]
MRNVFTIFKNDFRALTRHFLAFLIILAILFLPALYAWFNIYAFWDPYGKTKDVNIAVVCNDRDYMDEDGKIINIGNQLVEQLKADKKIGYVFLDDDDKAVDDLYAGKYYAAVIIEPDFTYNMYNFLNEDMFSPTINFYQNEKTNPIAVKVVEAAGDNVKQLVNKAYIQAVVETLFDKFNTFSEGVQGDNTVSMLKNTLAKIDRNLAQYDDTIDQFVAANNSLVGTLNNSNSTIDYTIHLLGSERINISKQISYLESTKNDLALINEEVNTLLTNLQDSVQKAIYKLDRLYNGGEDPDTVKETLKELERQYQELIDYLTHSGISGSQAEDALSALNKVKDKITQLREQLGMNTQVDANAADQLKADYNEITVPTVYTAVTGYDYDDLKQAQTTEQSMDTMMTFMADDAKQRIANIQKNVKIAKTTDDADAREQALTAARDDTAVVTQELSALGTAMDAVEDAAGTTDKKASKAAAQAADNTKDAGDIFDDILKGNRDIDLIEYLQVISDLLGNARVALTEIVYPSIDTLLTNLQDSLGDLSSILLDLSDVMGKVPPIVNELGNTFGAVNNALVQVKELIGNYRTRIADALGVLNGDTDDTRLQQVLDFMNVDPQSIAEFFASPVTIRSESVYPVESYGAAMAPFYTMLAIWVGCIILNAILKVDTPIELIGATTGQKFFGRYLIFALLSLIQTMVIMTGDLVIFGMDCAHPGLFILSGVVTSLTCSMVAYSMAIAFGNIGKALFVVFLIIQIAGSGGSYPIELLPDFFQQVYLFFPFPYAINAMREAIAGLYHNNYLIYLLQLLLFFGVGLFVGLVLKRPLDGINRYMNDQLDKSEMM